MSKESDTKYEMFAAAYGASLNATQAAIAAGYAKKSASQTGWRLLRNEKVQELLAKHRAKIWKEAEVTSTAIVEGLAKIAFNEYTYKTADRLKAFDLLGKKLGLWDGQSTDPGRRDRSSIIDRVSQAIAGRAD
jgi:phage terminase small subunit